MTIAPTKLCQPISWSQTLEFTLLDEQCDVVGLRDYNLVERSTAYWIRSFAFGSLLIIGSAMKA